MNTSDRRDFIKRTSAGVATALVTTLPAVAASESSSGDLRIGLIGAGGRGRHVAQLMAGEDGVQVSHVCDPDQKRLVKDAPCVRRSQWVDSYRHFLCDCSRIAEPIQLRF